MHGLNKVLFLNAPTSSSMNGKEYEYPVHLWICRACRYTSRYQHCKRQQISSVREREKGRARNRGRERQREREREREKEREREGGEWGNQARSYTQNDMVDVVKHFSITEQHRSVWPELLNLRPCDHCCCLRTAVLLLHCCGGTLP